ncbi:hypothetical protein GGD81_000601 [Rhodobium orientis]|nr:hypothetical protein [Rhodobium orientis]MBB4301584.1 hypothetical protein [Rhodobium orientis]
MPRRLATVVLLLAPLALATPASAYSKAANYLIKQQIRVACDGRPGRIRPEGVIERDLTGDGHKDLIINHDGIECRAEWSRSGYCGASACSVHIYVREGALLVHKTELLTGGIRIGRGSRPRISFYSLTEQRMVPMRWNGRTFD